MNKFYYFMQVLAIAICSTCAVMVVVSMLCSCTTSTTNNATVTNARLYTAATPETFSDVVCDTAAAQLAICERILDGCAEHGILDVRGVRVYERLKGQKSVAAYIELIAECEREENFYDTIGSGDEWCNYVWHVLEPRGLAE